MVLLWSLRSLVEVWSRGGLLARRVGKCTRGAAGLTGEGQTGEDCEVQTNVPNVGASCDDSLSLIFGGFVTFLILFEHLA